MYDIRDGNSYTIAKLPDGNCWMTQNLRLGDGTKTYTLTPANSDVLANWTLPIAQTSGDTSWGDTANTSNTPHLYATGNTSYGNYYNWYAATAGTGLGTMSSASATDLTNAAESICPKGWRLPDGGAVENSKSFYTLNKALGGTGANMTDPTLRNKYLASPYLFPYSGYYHVRSDGVHDQNSLGRWWSRSADATAGLAYSFYIDVNDRVYSLFGDYVGHGLTVRCLSR